MTENEERGSTSVYPALPRPAGKGNKRGWVTACLPCVPERRSEGMRTTANKPLYERLPLQKNCVPKKGVAERGWFGGGKVARG